MGLSFPVPASCEVDLFPYIRVADDTRSDLRLLNATRPQPHDSLHQPTPTAMPTLHNAPRCRGRGFAAALRLGPAGPQGNLHNRQSQPGRCTPTLARGGVAAMPDPRPHPPRTLNRKDRRGQLRPRPPQQHARSAAQSAPRCPGEIVTVVTWRLATPTSRARCAPVKPRSTSSACSASSVSAATVVFSGQTLAGCIWSACVLRS